MTLDQGTKTVRGNRDFPWDDFSPEEYFKFNYADLRDDDRQIVEIVSDFFTKAFSDRGRPMGVRGIDVGTGSNLYPALTMLPFCESLTLYDFSVSNVAWLKQQRAEGWPSWEEGWDSFWSVLSKKPDYRNITHPKDDLVDRVNIRRGDVLNLSVEDRWDMGTMFFVAESITCRHNEFVTALDHFFDMLKPGAPFAMGFMEHSQGYHVGQLDFPATDIGRAEVRDYLNTRAVEVKTVQLGPGDKPLRDQYTGMIVAHGWAK